MRFIGIIFMRWFVKLIKVFSVIFSAAFIIILAYLYVPDISALKSVYGFIKPVSSGSGHSLKNSTDSGNMDNCDDSRQNNTADIPETGNADSVENEQSEYRQSPENDESTDIALPGEETGNDIKNPDEYFITAREVASIEDLSLHDKLTGMAVLSKLDKDDIDKLFGIAVDGITNKEAGEIKQILEKSLSRGDIDTLVNILQKNRRAYADSKLAGK